MSKNKKPRKSLANSPAFKEFLNPPAPPTELLKPRSNKIYKPTMDNVLVEIVFAIPEQKFEIITDKDGNEEKKEIPAPYVASHLRPADYVKVMAIGPLVKDNKLIGYHVILVPSVRPVAIETDEDGVIAIIKPHEILAIEG